MGNRLRAARERGAVLALVAATLLLVLISGAIAVDLSALDRQGQTLQNTVDAAALAGVAEWTENGDRWATTELVEDLIAQNGIVLADGVSLDIEFPSPLELSIELSDTEPDVFLSGVIGMDGTLRRGAIARLETCDEGCDREIEVPEPFSPVRAIGSGDGFIPVLVGDRLYGVNHHSSTMSCVDRQTGAQCWSSKPLFNDSAGTTDNHYAEVVGTRIYYTGYSNRTRETAIACFDTVTDTRCATTAYLGNQGYGTLIKTDVGLLLFTANRKVFCVNPATMAECPDYVDGLDTGLAAVPDWSNHSSRAVWKSYRVAYDNRIYHAMSSAGKTWLHCWDLDDAEGCSAFDPQHLNDTRRNSGDNNYAGRLFFNRDASGTPISICSLGWNNVECRDLTNGQRITSHEGQFNALHTAMTGRSWNGWASMNTYHEPTNRLFTVNSNKSRTYCHDFNTNSYCGEAYNTSTSFGEIQTYGYIGEANCLIGLGDNSIFFTMKPDMSGECTGSGTEVTVTPCRCDGVAAWPPVGAKNLEGLSVFDVRVTAPDGTLLLPDDGSEWHDMLSGPIDLGSIDLVYPEVTIVIAVEAVTGAPDPWAGSTPPTFVIGIQDRDPQLID